MIDDKEYPIVVTEKGPALILSDGEQVYFNQLKPAVRKKVEEQLGRSKSASHQAFMERSKLIQAELKAWEDEIRAAGEWTDEPFKRFPDSYGEEE